MRTTTVVVGAGHAGLATSFFLGERSIDHVILERGEVANTWRTERWDSLRLLTPNWQSRLPGLGYDGDDPDGFMTMPEVIDFIARYAAAIDAPVRAQTTVTSVQRRDDGFVVETDAGTWECRSVVVASGAYNAPKVPAVASAVPSRIHQRTAFDYLRPSDLPEGAVLVVGASATGVQIAQEIHGSGRPVTIAVGGHVRMPRSYRGRDIQWWLDRTGLLDERYDEVDDIVRARRVPSPQLVGSPERVTVDLNTLTDQGVELVGRFAGISGSTAQLSGSLRNQCTLADLKLGRLLDTIDEWATANGLDAAAGPPERFAPTRVADSPRLAIDLDGGEFATIVWATGYRADYSWLHIPVLDRKGELRHDGGVVSDSPGLYRIGLNFLRRRKSSFIHGTEDDARDLTSHLAAYLGTRVPV